MIQDYSIYKLLLLGHRVAPYLFFVCFSTFFTVNFTNQFTQDLPDPFSFSLGEKYYKLSALLLNSDYLMESQFSLKNAFLTEK